MMKKEILTLGVWVYNKTTGAKQKILELRQDQVMLDDKKLYSYYEIEPIPLTEENLTENDFYGEQSPSTYNGGINVSIDFGDWPHMCRNLGYGMDILFVDKLQTILKLLEVDAQIEP